HMAVVALAGSVTLSATIDRLLTQLRLAFTGLNINPGIHGSFAQQNLAIIDRILNNQRVDASRGLHRYLDLAENMVIQYATADGKPLRLHVDRPHEAATRGHCSIGTAHPSRSGHRAPIMRCLGSLNGLMSRSLRLSV